MNQRLTMGERRLVVDQLKFSYEGLFNAGELFTIISSWFYEKGWDWLETMNQESVTAEGKHVRVILDPWKSSSEFYKITMHIKLHMMDLKDVEVEHQGETLRLNQGVVKMVIDGYVISDRTGKWISKEKPFYWFLTILFEKYFFWDHLGKLETWIKSDIDDLHQKIKNYLNVFKYTYQT